MANNINIVSITNFKNIMKPDISSSSEIVISMVTKPKQCQVLQRQNSPYGAYSCKLEDPSERDSLLRVD